MRKPTIKGLAAEVDYLFPYQEAFFARGTEITLAVDGLRLTAAGLGRASGGVCWLDGSGHVLLVDTFCAAAQAPGADFRVRELGWLLARAQVEAISGDRVVAS